MQEHEGKREQLVVQAEDNDTFHEALHKFECGWPKGAMWGGQGTGNREGYSVVKGWSDCGLQQSRVFLHQALNDDAAAKHCRSRC